MNKIKNFSDFRASIDLVDLKQIHLIAHSDRFAFSSIDHVVQTVGSLMFDFVLPPGIYPETINKDLPVYNYGNHEEINDLIKSGVIKNKNVYNKPGNLSNASDKVKFHKKMEGVAFVPKTVFTVVKAKNLKFPVIGKPKDGAKGKGIEIFKNKAELDEFDKLDTLDMFSQKFDLQKEYRVISFKGEPLYIAERIPINKKSEELRETEETDVFMKPGDGDDKSSYDWKVKTFGKGCPSKAKIKTICKKTHDTLKLDILGVDIGIDKKGKLWLIEANTCPGLNGTQIVEIYIAIFEDFYKRKPEQYSAAKIEEYREELKLRSEDDANFTFSPRLGKLMNYTEKDSKTASIRSNLERSFGAPLKDIKDK